MPVPGPKADRQVYHRPASSLTLDRRRPGPTLTEVAAVTPFSLTVEVRGGIAYFGSGLIGPARQPVAGANAMSALVQMLPQARFDPSSILAHVLGGHSFL